MEGNYDVTLNAEPVGKVQVLKEGLYLRIHCRCHLDGDVCRLLVHCGEREENLGILVPKDGQFVLDTKIPAKRLGQGSYHFTVVPKKAVLAGKFIPISPEEPFAYIERLKEAHLVRRGGKMGILLPEG